MWRVLKTYQDCAGVANICRINLVSTEEPGSKSGTRQLHVENAVSLQVVLRPDDSVVHRVRKDLVLLLLLHFGNIVITFLGVRFSLNFAGVFLTHCYKLLKVVSKIHFDEHTALAPILTMAIADGEEVLVESLADVRCEDEVVLVLFIDIVH